MLPVIYSMGLSLDGFIGSGWRHRLRARLTQSGCASTSSRPATSPHTCADAAYTRRCWCGEPAEQTMSGEAELEFARIWRPIPKVVFSRTLNSVAGNARLATDDIATEVARLRDQPGEGVVSIGGAGLVNLFEVQWE